MTYFKIKNYKIVHIDGCYKKRSLIYAKKYLKIVFFYKFYKYIDKIL